MALVTGYFIFIVAIFILLFLLTKKILKTVLLGILVVFIVTGIVGFLIFDDVKDLVENFPDTENKIIFVLEDKIIGGIVTQGFDFEKLSEEEDFPLIETEEIKELNKNYPNNLDLVLNDSFKLVIIDSNMIEESKLDEEIKEESEFIQNLPNNGKDALTIIKQEDSLSYYYEQYLINQGLTEFEIEVMKEAIKTDESASLIFENSNSFRSFLVLLHFTNLANQNPLSLLGDFGEGKIKVYPETIAIKIAKEVPSIALRLIPEE